ncbi:hypothetical protein [Halanaeroarchaeum sp. HSR-CO]|nr:hypothetical protein [Halanaeroarchaeum sp. HSR-CO]
MSLALRAAVAGIESVGGLTADGAVAGERVFWVRYVVGRAGLIPRGD